MLGSTVEKGVRGEGADRAEDRRPGLLTLPQGHSCSSGGRASGAHLSFSGRWTITASSSVAGRSARRPTLRAVLTRCWPCKSNSVCLSSCHLPRPEGSIDGLRAFSRNPGRRASPTSVLLGPAARLPRFAQRSAQTVLARRRVKGRRVVPMAGVMAKIRKWLGLGKKS
jgi:hypothetical protein